MSDKPTHEERVRESQEGAPGDETGEETEPTEDLDESAGIEGQILYPEADVDPERAGEYVAGKTDTLRDEDEPGWENPADRSGEEQTDATDESDEDRSEEDRSEGDKKQGRHLP